MKRPEEGRATTAAPHHGREDEEPKPVGCVNSVLPANRPFPRVGPEFVHATLAATLSDGTLAFQMQRLAELPLTAVVVEARTRRSSSWSTSTAAGSQTNSPR